MSAHAARLANGKMAIGVAGKYSAGSIVGFAGAPRVIKLVTLCNRKIHLRRRRNPQPTLGFFAHNFFSPPKLPLQSVTCFFQSWPNSCMVWQWSDPNRASECTPLSFDWDLDLLQCNNHRQDALLLKYSSSMRCPLSCPPFIVHVMFLGGFFEELYKQSPLLKKRNHLCSRSGSPLKPSGRGPKGEPQSWERAWESSKMTSIEGHEG